ncbi:uncharacterized protein PITG_19830 [Phytophthora infestans T30-4]|uniref:Uncharacterized protein n=1 Tax=Phytophthora infestans (strain T30-4) TaxID=403677 RepID=D0P1D9_PHYIT|nr:uncharacterized protein PITG_19830 [Phytophthora infestans T30-4]EEY54172.1 conserved hypothetical protein [Phytophthora infestans T30-4]|eukprot:XP_002895886.1 conserved hypothetical protein [Phytophthora infestans T30-4]
MRPCQNLGFKALKTFPRRRKLDRREAYTYRCSDLGGAISWRRRDLDLSVALRSMVFVNETVSLPPRQLVSVALDRASALLVGALDVQSVSMASLAVPRWSDFVLLHRVKNGGEWQVSGELQSSDARWLKTAEVVLAPRTAKSQASQVSGCDGVNERDTGGRGVVAIRGGGGLSLGPEHTGPSVSGVDCTAAADRGGEPGGRACVGFDGGLGRLQVMSWTHRYREYSKMADKLVNMAMDACFSVQVLFSDESCSSVKWTEPSIRVNDGGHWLSRSFIESISRFGASSS